MSADRAPAKRTGESIRLNDIVDINVSSVRTGNGGGAFDCTSNDPLLDRKTPVKSLPGRSRSSTVLKFVERALQTHRRLRLTILAATIASIPSILGGYTLAFPSSALLDLTGDVVLPKDYRFNTHLSELFAAVALFGAMVGGPVGGFIADQWGRKSSLVLCAVPVVFGYLVISYAHYLPTAVSFKAVLLTGRFFTGIGLGWGIMVGPVYIGELSPAKFRGVLVIFNRVGFVTGVLLSYIMGSIPGFPYYYSSLVAAGIITVFLVLMVWMKETPRWLFSKGLHTEFHHSLSWLRGPNVDVDDEIRALQSSKKTSIWMAWKEFSKRNVAVPVLIVIVMTVFLQISGRTVFFSYAASLFKEAGVANPRITALYLVGAAEFLATFIAIFTIDIFGRKSLLLISGVGMTVGSTLLGVHFYLTRHSLCSSSAHNSAILDLAETKYSDTPCNTQYGPLALTSMIIFNVTSSVGWGAVPWVLYSEMIPLQVRGLAGGIVNLVNSGMSALVVGVYLDYAAAVELWFAWWTFAIINALGIVFVAVFIRETKGKTLEDIENYYKEHWI